MGYSRYLYLIKKVTLSAYCGTANQKETTKRQTGSVSTAALQPTKYSRYLVEGQMSTPLNEWPGAKRLID